jgi:thiosulfate/3-mercaptopyruvate sulfurtransferase
VAGYAHPDVLVETDWVAAHHADPTVRLIEADEAAARYDEGHIPHALRLHWKDDLQDPLVRDWVSRDRFARLLGDRGVGDRHTVVLYGDRTNWFAAYVFWLFKYYGHQDVRLLNGGRDRWLRDGRPLVTEVPRFPPVEYRPGGPDPSLRVFRDEVLRRIGDPSVALVDVRSPAEFSGELLAPPAYPQEGAQRGGHIPGARNIPWSENALPDGRFKPAEELRQLYGAHGIRPEQEVIAYCRIGERSSLTWFTLKYLLGYERVRNYDGSWTEWGSLVGVPIER